MGPVAGASPSGASLAVVKFELDVVARRFRNSRREIFRTGRGGETAGSGAVGSVANGAGWRGCDTTSRDWWSCNLDCPSGGSRADAGDCGCGRICAVGDNAASRSGLFGSPKLEP